jgi:hypothetical protein
MNRSGEGGDADLVDVEAGSTVRIGTKNQSTAMKKSSRMMVIGSGIMSDGDLVRSGAARLGNRTTLSVNINEIDGGIRVPSLALYLHLFSLLYKRS